MKTKVLLSSAVFMISAFVAIGAQAAVDEAGAKNLLNENGCLNCHDVTKTKVARSYKKIAAERKGKSGAEAAITKHLTQPNMVKVGEDMVDHPQIEADPAQVKNLVKWILSR
ncbi:MAG: cytochrome C [Gallionella sp.]|nr:cytochrome C [Gallionella sp.]